MDQANRSQEGSGIQDRPTPIHIDSSLARGLVRHEARQIGAAHQQIRHIPDELYSMIADRFRGRRRLSASDVKLLAHEIDRTAGRALSSICSSEAQRLSSRFRPNSVRYDIVHYLVEAVPQPVQSNRAPSDRIMRLCVFAARLDQREVAMTLREIPICFWEHAARRYLSRGGQEHDAGVRSIARRLAGTYILPAMALRVLGKQAVGSSLAIPHEGGLLLGGFQDEPKPENSGGYVTFNRLCMRQRTLPYTFATNFVVRTYINPRQLAPDQQTVAREIESWLATHQEAAQAAIMGYHRLDSEAQRELMARESWEALKADFLSMWERLQGLISQGDNQCGTKFCD